MKSEVALDAAAIEIKRLFVTPVAQLAHPQAEALNAALREVILARRDAQPGVSHSNEGGWQSSHDFVDWAGEPGRCLADFANAFASQLTAVYAPPHGLIEPAFTWRYNAWANVNEAGQSNALHGHPGAFWSGVYWVDDGRAQEGEEVGGELEFIDPRGLVPSVYNPDLRMRIEGCVAAGCSTTLAPRSGTFTMFPSWLMHAVRRYRGSRPRISVAFNFGL
ncbi:TIGR02466 family protein [Pseudomonas sp. LRF_L74]|uniref:TIGR02466 family protein n=1 Tax=Pseudomonas sp. LRF_L74 TaxID=3369422 RepID=UPI003F647FB4